MIHFGFIKKELLQAKSQSFIFVLCVALSITTLISLNGLKVSVNESILGDTRKLSGGDVIVRSHYPFSSQINETLAGVTKADDALLSASLEFYSVLQDVTSENSLLVNIKSVEQNYPLYGEVQLKSGRSLHKVLKPGFVVVVQQLLDRLELGVGDTVKAGKAELVIIDIVLHEPSQPVNFFVLGPRMLVAAKDLSRMDLVKAGSRATYKTSIKTKDAEAFDRVERELVAASEIGQEKIETFKNSRSRVKRFFENLFFFLSLISIFTLLLAGIGMQSSLGALLRQKEKTLAVIKSMGASNGFILLNYYILVFTLGLVGTVLGIFAAAIFTKMLPALLVGLVPLNSFSGLSLGTILQGFLLGILAVSFFTFLPLYNLRNIRPVVIFHNAADGVKKSFVYYVMIAGGMILLTILVALQLKDVMIGAYFLLGCLGLIVFVYLFTWLTSKIIAKIPISSLIVKQSIKSLFRPGNSSKAVIVTLASALSVLLTIFLLQKNLHTNFVDSFPKDAPTLFAIDIQPHQKAQFIEIVGKEPVLHPVIRARLLAINDIPVNREKELKKKRDSLAREFNLSYRENLLANEYFVQGESLFGNSELDKDLVAVSILDMVTDIGGIQYGDILSFNVQGRPMNAKVTSVRSRSGSKLSPFFYFIFPTEVLQHAPQTFFAALHIDHEKVSGVEKAIVSAMPNVSMINMAETAKQLDGVVQKLSSIVTTFAAFSIFAGCLILVSSVFSTRIDRIQETVFYKILGSNSSFVRRVFLYENMLLGFVSSCIAIMIAQLVSWSICRFMFEISPNSYAVSCIVFMIVIIGLVVCIGVAGSYSIVKHKPALFLQNQGDL